MTRCLVTGASGHLGSYLVRALLAYNAEVTALVRPQSDLWRLDGVIDRVKLIRVDLAHLEAAKDAINTVQPEACFHLAWTQVTSEGRDQSAQITHNTTDSLKLFETVREAGCRCWVGVGSLAEYGPYDHALTEDLPTHPTSAYATAKLCLGLLTAKLCDLAGMRYLWFRMTGTYGPKDDPRHLVPSVITRLLKGEKPALTPGEQHWDYLYIADATEAIAQAALQTEAAGVFNLGSGATHTIKQIAEITRDLIDPALPLGLGEISYGPNQVMHLEANIRRLQAATGWTPQTNLEDGLKHTIGWYRSPASTTIQP